MLLDVEDWTKTSDVDFEWRPLTLEVAGCNDVAVVAIADVGRFGCRFVVVAVADVDVVSCCWTLKT